MMKIRKALVVVLMALFSALAVPACTLRIGPGGDDFDRSSSSNDESEGGSGAGRGGATDHEPTAPEEETDAELFSRVDPAELAFASAKATVTTSALNGILDALPLDPESLDEATLLALMEQYMPQAAEQTDLWLASVDASAFPPAPIPKYSCEEDHGCQIDPKCTWGFDPGVRHRCVLVDCGASRCSWCPSWVANILAHLALKSWCAYVCVQTGVSPAPTVAVGAGGISSLGRYFVGPICTSL
jgi:hypothetical protein